MGRRGEQGTEGVWENVESGVGLGWICARAGVCVRRLQSCGTEGNDNADTRDGSATEGKMPDRRTVPLKHTVRAPPRGPGSAAPRLPRCTQRERKRLQRGRADWWGPHSPVDLAGLSEHVLSLLILERIVRRVKVFVELPLALERLAIRRLELLAISIGHGRKALCEARDAEKK